MIRHLFASSLLLLGTACGSGDLSGPGTASGLVLSAAVSTPSFEAGQADTITITLTNTTPNVITLHFGDGCQILPYVADANGDVVLPSGGGWGCTAALSQLSLAPHEVQTARFIWTGSTTFSSEMPLRTLPRGLYHVFATLHASEAHLTTERIAVQLQ